MLITLYNGWAVLAGCILLSIMGGIVRDISSKGKAKGKRQGAGDFVGGVVTAAFMALLVYFAAEAVLAYLATENATLGQSIEFFGSGIAGYIHPELLKLIKLAGPRAIKKKLGIEEDEK
jgi:hypothetical protein